MDDSGDVLDVFLEDFIKETRPFYLAIIVLVIVLIFIQNMVMYLPNPVY
jgi:TRAP-type C4-dicarboxylate transport system permease large subunit